GARSECSCFEASSHQEVELRQSAASCGQPARAASGGGGVAVPTCHRPTAPANAGRTARSIFHLGPTGPDYKPFNVFLLGIQRLNTRGRDNGWVDSFHTEVPDERQAASSD